MAFIDHARRRIGLKIVYYGPGLGGKTTHLLYLYSRMHIEKKGKFISLQTETDRTLFFDFLPWEAGHLRGYSLTFNLYAVPGQVFYDSSRALILRGADGVLMVYDSQQMRQDTNIESLQNLKHNLRLNNMNLDDVPVVLTYNKRDVPHAVPISDMEGALNQDRQWKSFDTIATEGKNVFAALRALAKDVTRSVAKKIEDVALTRDFEIRKEAIPLSIEEATVRTDFRTNVVFLGQWNPVEFEISMEGQASGATKIQFLGSKKYDLHSMNVDNALVLDPVSQRKTGVVWVRPQVRSSLRLRYRVGGIEKRKSLHVDTSILAEAELKFDNIKMLVAMFIDIAGSSEVWRKKSVAAMMMGNLKILLLCIAGKKGRINKVIGDAFLVVFDSPSAALVSAGKLMCMVKERRGIYGAHGVGIKIGIEIGEIALEDWNVQRELELVGSGVVRASRYCDLAKEGQIVISRVLYEIVKDNFEDEPFEFSPKVVKLKGISDQEVFFVRYLA